MIEIKSIRGDVLFTAESAADVRTALAEAARRGADLYGADLYGADLYGANLRGANLRGADLRSANLGSANLSFADLYGADLHAANLHAAYLHAADLYAADLYGANLRGANLHGADLRGADLRGADLYGADLRGADLYGADLRGADLRGADLYGADLRGADLYGAKNAELAIAQTRILPDGDLIGWKKCRSNTLVKLRIPADAARFNASGRKCRAEYAEVLEIHGPDALTETAYSQYDEDFEYRVGDTVRPWEPFDPNPFNECASGIHFYITREEAEAN